MPVIVEAESASVTTLLGAMPTGSHSVASVDRMHAWLDQHDDEYVVVLGPSLSLDAALGTAEDLRTTRPTVSVVLVREQVDTDVLARSMHAGIRDVVVATNEDKSLTKAIERAHQLFTALRGPGGARQVGRVVTVFSPKGGVGKTTSSVNLALALTDRGARKVCLVDLDLAFGDVAITMQLFPTHSIEQAVGAEDLVDLAMLEGLLTRSDSLTVLAAPSHPDVRERITPLLISRILRALREGFDYIVVDTSPSFDDATLTALDETDECVIVATLDVPTLKNVKVALETMDMLNIARGHRHLLLNRADDAVGISVEKVESILAMPVSSQVATAVDIAAATNAGTPIVTHKPQHPASIAYAQLAASVTGEPVSIPNARGGEAPGEQGRSRGLFRRGRNS